LLLAVCAGILACAGKPTLHFASDPAARFDHLRTWAWYDDPTFQMPGGGSIVDGRFVDEHVRAAVDRGLTKKGLQRVETGQADLNVAYHTDTVGVVSQDKFGGYDWWSGYVYVGAKYQKKGALTLDIRDAKYKLVWRGEMEAIVGRNPEAIARDIDNAVAELLSKFPPGGATR